MIGQLNGFFYDGEVVFGNSADVVAVGDGRKNLCCGFVLLTRCGNDGEIVARSDIERGDTYLSLKNLFGLDTLNVKPAIPLCK